jgi:hypothetical protein
MNTHTRRQVLGFLGIAGCATMVRKDVLAASRRYHDRVLEKGPVAFWRFAEGSGSTARDASGHGHAGTYRGGVVRGESRIQGEAAVGLNGSDAFVEIASSDAFSQPASGRGLTVEVWMRPDGLTFAGQTDQHYIHWLGKGDAGAYEWGFRFYSNDSPSRPNRISAYIWNSTSAPGVSNEGAGAYFEDPLTAGEWMHIVACFDAGDAGDPLAGVSIYKNGELRESPRRSKAARYASYNIHPAHANAQVRLGTRDLGSFLRGGLADVAIYPRVLSASEILDNYSGA